MDFQAEISEMDDKAALQVFIEELRGFLKTLLFDPKPFKRGVDFIAETRQMLQEVFREDAALELNRLSIAVADTDPDRLGKFGLIGKAWRAKWSVLKARGAELLTNLSDAAPHVFAQARSMAGSLVAATGIGEPLLEFIDMVSNAVSYAKG